MQSRGASRHHRSALFLTSIRQFLLHKYKRLRPGDPLARIPSHFRSRLWPISQPRESGSTRSAADMTSVAESDAMNHCAGRDKSYARRVAGGRLYFYRMIEPERLTIAIRPRGDWWAVEEIRGICNRQPSELPACSFGIGCGSPPNPRLRAPAPKARLLRALRLLSYGKPARPRRGTPENQLSFDFSVSL